MDKTKFTINPQLDSEGFVMSDAKCWGCPGTLPCSRSGSCERYMSPLRDQQTWATPRSLHDVSALLLKHSAVTLDPSEFTRNIDVELANAHLDGINPAGWNEPGMTKINWADEHPDNVPVEAKKAMAEMLLRGKRS